MPSRRKWFCRCLLRAVLPLCMALVGARLWADPLPIFHAHFSRWAGPPLIKTKFGMYETPFLTKENLLRAAALLPEAGVQDLRYEMGRGKPDTYAFDQISGSTDAPRINFASLDPFLMQLKRQGVAPLLALCYDPVPLKTGTE